MSPRVYRFRHTTLLLLLLEAVLLGRRPAAATPIAPDSWRVEQGEIGGAPWAAAIPANWNRHVLLLAPGFVPEGAPRQVEFHPERPASRALLEQGWIVATTRYRRNGLILADAAADLDALRGHLAAAHGEPELVLLEGESMGGWIVTAQVERRPELYHGAVAIGAALDLREPGTSGLSLQPQRPLVFLTNRSEFDGPRAYVRAPLPREIPPVLLRVERDGHVNVNDAERAFARRTLLAWIGRGPATLPRPPAGADFADATHEPPARPSAVVADADGRGFRTAVTAVHPVYGNVTLDAQPGDFTALGLGRMAYAELVLGEGAAERRVRVRYARSFEDVPQGDWVLFTDAEGTTTLARNFAHAAESGGLAPGSTVRIRRYQSAD